MNRNVNIRDQMGPCRVNMFGAKPNNLGCKISSGANAE